MVLNGCVLLKVPFSVNTCLCLFVLGKFSIRGINSIYCTKPLSNSQFIL